MDLLYFALMCLALRVDVTVFTAREGLTALAWTIATVLLVLGMMHFFNLYVFARMRRSRATRTPAAA